MDEPTILADLESYYDTAPRPRARTEQVGPFTLFVRSDPEGWPYYARPRLGLDVACSVADVDAVRRRQREVGAPEALEWVHETTPTLLAAARSSGLEVQECPLLVLGALAPEVRPGVDTGPEVRVLGPDDDLAAVAAAVHAAFHDTDEVAPGTVGPQSELIRAGLLATVAAYQDGVVMGGGSHGPRGTTTEIVGVAVLPRARRTGVGAAVTRALVADAHQRGLATVFLSAQDAAVARVYERIGFVRVATACIASA